MKNFFLLFSAAVVSAGLAVPTVDNVEIAQDANRVVRISYDLHDGPAIVTFDVTTNGVSPAGGAFDRSWGDVNKLVTNETGRFTIRWLPPEGSFDDVIAAGDIAAEVRAWSPDSPPDYAVFDMECASNVYWYSSVERLPGGIGSARYRKEMLAMRRIHAAGVRWRMGSPTWQPGERVATNETPRWVTLSEDYYVSVFELTQGQYVRLWGSTSSGWTIEGIKSGSSLGACNTNFCSDADLFPLSAVPRTELRGSAAQGFAWPGNGHDVSSDVFLGRLRMRTGFEFDMPTHAQWEYACRAGQGAGIYNGRELHTTSGIAADGSLTNIAWYAGNLLSGLYKKAPVGMLDPNDWGLYDMLGNVWEYVLDRQDGPRSGTEVTDPTGPATGSVYIQVGSAYYQGNGLLRCAYYRSIAENSSGTDYGYRLCCPVNRTWKTPVTVVE